ncbi:MAG: hypothetical protein ABJC19_04525 [Gemmatimonadota bacterium]
MRLLLSLLLGTGLVTASANNNRDTYPRQPGIDVEHYRFASALSDSTDVIRGEATVTVRFTRDGLKEFFLDLTTPSGGKGMTVTAVRGDSAPLRYRHTENRLHITLAAPSKAGELRRFTIPTTNAPKDVVLNPDISLLLDAPMLVRDPAPLSSIAGDESPPAAPTTPW